MEIKTFFEKRGDGESVRWILAEITGVLSDTTISTHNTEAEADEAYDSACHEFPKKEFMTYCIRYTPTKKEAKEYLLQLQDSLAEVKQAQELAWETAESDNWASWQTLCFLIEKIKFQIIVCRSVIENKKIKKLHFLHHTGVELEGKSK